MNTITFSQPIDDPVMAIWSLGNPGTITQYVFPTTEIVNIEGGGPSSEYGGSSIYLVTGANAITGNEGNEGNGVIEFLGNHSSITFTNPVNEVWYGFTLGVPGDCCAADFDTRTYRTRADSDRSSCARHYPSKASLISILPALIN